MDDKTNKQQPTININPALKSSFVGGRRRTFITRRAFAKKEREHETSANTCHVIEKNPPESHEIICNFLHLKCWQVMEI